MEMASFLARQILEAAAATFGPPFSTLQYVTLGSILFRNILIMEDGQVQTILWDT